MNSDMLYNIVWLMLKCLPAFILKWVEQNTIFQYLQLEQQFLLTLGTFMGALATVLLTTFFGWLISVFNHLLRGSVESYVQGI